MRDPHRRLDEQDLDGIVGEVMYPSLNMFTFAIPDREVVSAVFERHNDWVLDYCSVAPERLIGIGCLGLPDVDIALAEMQRAATRGVRGFAIPAHVSPDRPYCHEDYDRFWAAAQDFGVPLTMHIFTGSSLDGGHARALGHAGRHDQGLHDGPHDGDQHDDRPHLRRRLRALPRAQVRDLGVRDRLGGAVPRSASTTPPTARRTSPSTTSR